MKTKIFLVTGFCRQHNKALTNANAKHRLLSYYYHKDGRTKDDYIPIFVNIGYDDKGIKDEDETLIQREIKNIDQTR